MKMALGVFLRDPVPGRVKTRLAAALGAEHACRLYVEFVKATVALARGSGLPLTFFCDPPHAAENVRVRFQLTEQIEPQGDGDLGARMRQALKLLLRDAEAAILIGSDSPDLPVEYLSSAARELERNDLVLGPAIDGGYYLIGMTRRGFQAGQRPLFENITWGTNEVFSRTVDAARDCGLSAFHLPEWHDIDRVEDLSRVPEFTARADTPTPPLPPSPPHIP